MTKQLLFYLGPDGQTVWLEAERVWINFEDLSASEFRDFRGLRKSSDNYAFLFAGWAFVLRVILNPENPMAYEVAGHYWQPEENVADWQAVAPTTPATLPWPENKARRTVQVLGGRW